jgi:tetratricopeptide (TPR) repeat protein
VYRYLYILLVSLLVAGCAGPLKQGWYNFTAYYNTFYNANQYFDEGLKQNERQTPALNPLQPIRIHKSPSNAGHEQFVEAIDRGASILRNHERSKYVNPAIFLIGRSYYYRGEYFSALEKFQELQTVSSGSDLQKAIVWQGRTYLEMESVAEGIRFLEIETEYIEEWDPALQAEIHALLAQLYVKQRNWYTASEYLHMAAGSLEVREMQARAYFLHGQVLEEMGNDPQALAAYRLAAGIRAGFDIEFNSLRKQAEMSRSTGDYDTALRLYRRLSRDDKYIDHHTEMRYELARTHQVMGNSEHALQLYNELLHDRFVTPGTVTQAQAYFGMAEIYRDDLGSFTMAAAYFDSAASLRVDPSRISGGFNAGELAESFGEYARIKNRINRADSLLRLAELEPEELESLLEELQQQMLAEQERQATEQQRTADRLVADPVMDAGDVTDAADRLEHGFLNISNRMMVTDASLQFQAVWGDRPLADNWRRRSAVPGTRFDQIVLSDDEVLEGDQTAAAGGAQAGVPVPDLSDIPFSEEDRLRMKTEREELSYRLANLFMLSLNMPDSARVYYESVVEGGLNPALTPRSLYSLTDIELSGGNRGRAEMWAEKLMNEWPDSEYSERISSLLNLPYVRRVSYKEIPAEQRYQMIMTSEELEHPADKANELRRLAEDVRGDEQKARILFESARKYLEAAMQESDGRNPVWEWTQIVENYEAEKRHFTAVQDSVRSLLADPDAVFSEEERDSLQVIADSGFETESLSERFPLEGAWWDSTRSVLEQLETEYASASVIPSVRILRESIRRPADPPRYTVDRVERFPEELMPRDPAPADLQSCSDAGLRPDAGSGPDQVMQYVRYPQWARDAEIRSEIIYKITVNPDGTVTEFEQVSQMDRSGIPEAIEQAIERHLRYQPLEQDEPVTCTVTFRIET